MLRLSIKYTKMELDAIMQVIHFTPIEQRIMKYMLDDWSRQMMADEENVSPQVIDRAKKDIVTKIQKACESKEYYKILDSLLIKN